MGKAILTGIIASMFFTPIGGIAIGIMTYHLDKKEKEKNDRD